MDFSNCKIGLRFYGGSEQKKSLIINDEIYMIKFPKKAKEKEKLDESYTNNIYSEYLGCHILKSIGFETQETLLGRYGDKEIVACKDFVTENWRLYEFAQIKNSVITDTETSGYGTVLEDVLQAIDEQQVMDSEMLKCFFWDLFIADAFIGNFDRHNANWGFLINEEERLVKIAPVYDCGSCLYPKLSDKETIRILNDPDEINKRMFIFPNSALKHDGRKINYYDFIHSGRNEDCNHALLRIFPKISLVKINDIIQEMPMISTERKEFYRVMIQARYNQILAPAFQSIIDRNKMMKREKNCALMPNSKTKPESEWEDEFER